MQNPFRIAFQSNFHILTVAHVAQNYGADFPADPPDFPQHIHIIVIQTLRSSIIQNNIRFFTGDSSQGGRAVGTVQANCTGTAQPGDGLRNPATRIRSILQN